MRVLRRTLFLAAVCTGTVFGWAGAAVAQQTPVTGQPGTTAGFNCGTSSAPLEPGQASSASGSAFNENGGVAGSVYAGNGSASINNTNSSAAVSQYDTACRELSSHAGLI